MPEEDKKPDEASAPAEPSSEEAGSSSSLEQPSTQVEDQPDDDADALEKSSAKPTQEQAAQAVSDSRSWRERMIRKLGSINPYLVLFVLVVLLGLVIVFISNRLNNQNDPTNLTFDGSELNQEELDELLKAEQNIGTVDQTLTVAANAIFEGKVLVKSDLDVAGDIRIGGSLILPDITVGGTSEFNELKVQDLAISGSATIAQALTVQGAANINGNLSVGGTISAGAISADSIEFSGDLNLTRHIDTGGSTPQAVNGTAVGSGGTVSISGNDIAGTVTINTGGGPPSGIMVRVTFARTYNNTPYVQVTPIGSATGSLDYYVERDTSGFRVGTLGAPSASTTYKFDYFIAE